MEDFRKRKLKEDEKSLWEQMGRKEEETPSRWDYLKKRVIGEKTAREVAEEQAEELRKKKSGL